MIDFTLVCKPEIKRKNKKTVLTASY